MFKLNVAPNITKELLLSHNTQETYLEHYLGIPVKKGLFKSPSCIRTDNKPTCAFYKTNRGIVKYKDFHGPTFDFIGAVMYLKNCSYSTALRIIANDFNIIKSEKLEVNPPKISYTHTVLDTTEKAKIQVEVKEFSEKELKWWKSFGITKTTLLKFKVFSIKSVFLNGRYFTSSSDKTPIYGYYGGVDSDGVELWRIYTPSKLKYRFLSNWPSTKIQGSRQIPKESDYIIITKSLKDVMTLYEFGLYSVAPTSETAIMSESKINYLKEKYKNVYILFDNDLAGVQYSHKYKKLYGIKCIFIKRNYAKDISDLHKKISETQFWIAIESLNSIVKDNICETKHFYIF